MFIAEVVSVEENIEGEGPTKKRKIDEDKITDDVEPSEITTERTKVWFIVHFVI